MRANEYVLGIDIGGTNIRAGLVAPDYTLSGFAMSSSKSLFDGRADPVPALRDYVLAYCEQHLGGEKPAAVCAGFPATVNKARDTVLSTPNLENFNNVNVVRPLGAALGIPVFINKDVHLLLLNDIHATGLGGQIITGCYVGTGIGGSIFVGGQILEGKNGVAGEFGHLPVAGIDRACGCGNVGCTETVASGRRLQEINDECFAGEAIGGIFTNHLAHERVRHFVHSIAATAATVVNLLDPDTFVLGGGILHMDDFPYEALVARIHYHSRKPYPDENLCIVRSAATQESGVMGAGMYAFQKLQGLP